MIFLELFLGFLWVGCFSFGGAYGAIPLIRDVVLSHGWLDEESLTYMIAVSESTPGPIMVNLATGTYMVLNHCLPLTPGSSLDVRATIITAALFAASWSTKHFFKKKISPIMLILLSAGLGVMVYGGFPL